MNSIQNPVKPGINIKLALVLVTILFTLMGCSGTNNSSDSSNTSNTDDNLPFELTSSAFADGGRLDIKYTNTNGNTSIPLEWNKAPEGTKSFAIFMVDLHPVANNWAHWVVIDIPADARSLAEDVSKTDMLPTGSKELKNSFGGKGYGGPQPPRGSGDHEYKTIIYALDVETLDIATDKISYADFETLVENHIIEKAEISGFYENE